MKIVRSIELEELNSLTSSSVNVNDNEGVPVVMTVNTFELPLWRYSYP